MASRTSWLRSTGWTRLGLAGAAAAAFSTPMLWAMGSFGIGDEAMHRAIIYALSGLWSFIAVGWLVGWSLQGFVIPQKSHDDSDDDDAPPRHAPTPPPPPRQPPPKRDAH